MSANHAVVRGTLQPDGTLALDESPKIPAGPVEVVVRSTSAQQTAVGDWWQYLQRARADLEAAGASFASGEQIDAYLEQVRGETDRVEALYETMEWQKHHGSRRPC